MRNGTLHRAVFLDRDGTLNEERNYLSDPSKVVLIPGVIEGLMLLSQFKFLLFIVTNQSGIGRGYYTVEAMHSVNQRVQELLVPYGVTFQRIYFAPEAPENVSRGRKPSPQFLFDARDEFGLDLSASYMIGDKAIDLECGVNAGVRRSILVRSGYGKEVETSGADRRFHAKVVTDLIEGAEWIRKDMTHIPTQTPPP